VANDVESILLYNVKNMECNDSLKQIIKLHSPLFYDVYKKYYSALKSHGVSQSDMEGDRDYIIYQAIKKFDSTKKTKFSTWLGNFTRYYCLNLMNSRKKYVYSSEENELDYFNNADFLIDKNNSGEIQEFAMHVLSRMKDERIKKIFHLRYFCESIKKNTWSQIGKKLNISTQTAINLHEKGKKMLYNKLSSKQNEDLV